MLTEMLSDLWRRFDDGELDLDLRIFSGPQEFLFYRLLFEQYTRKGLFVELLDVLVAETEDPFLMDYISILQLWTKCLINWKASILLGEIQKLLIKYSPQSSFQGKMCYALLSRVMADYHIYKLDENRQAIPYLQNALHIFEEIGMIPEVISLHNKLGNEYQAANIFEDALNHFERGFELAHENNFERMKTIIRGNIAELNFRMGDFDNFHSILEELESMLKIDDEILNFAYLLMKRAELMILQGNYSEAIELLSSASTLYDNYPRNKVLINILLGKCHEELDNLEQAEMLYEEGYTSASLNNYNELTMYALRHMVKVALLQKMPESAKSTFEIMESRIRKSTPSRRASAEFDLAKSQFYLNEPRFSKAVQAMPALKRYVELGPLHLVSYLEALEHILNIILVEMEIAPSNLVINDFVNYLSIFKRYVNKNTSPKLEISYWLIKARRSIIREDLEEAVRIVGELEKVYTVHSNFDQKAIKKLRGDLQEYLSKGLETLDSAPNSRRRLIEEDVRSYIKEVRSAMSKRRHH